MPHIRNASIRGEGCFSNRSCYTCNRVALEQTALNIAEALRWKHKKISHATVLRDS